MSDIESLALLIADMNRQLRVLQEENAQLRTIIADGATPPAG